jgi:hypothetical protein
MVMTKLGAITLMRGRSGGRTSTTEMLARGPDDFSGIIACPSMELVGQDALRASTDSIAREEDVMQTELRTLARAALWSCFLVAAPACAGDSLGRLKGALTVRVSNVEAGVSSIDVELERLGVTTPNSTVQLAEHPVTRVDIKDLAPAQYQARVVAEDAQMTPTAAVFVSDILILDSKTTEIDVDLGQGGPIMPPAMECDPQDSMSLSLCTICVNGFIQTASDDARCGAISCSGLDTYAVRGDNTATGRARCVKVSHPDITANRCADRGRCIAPNGPSCQAVESTIATAAICQTVAGCESGSPSTPTVPDGTPCGGTMVCESGLCVEPMSPPSPGCADGTREGFLSQTDYPKIAGCAGAWSVAGVTVNNAAPTCGRSAGNTGTNGEGIGCSAVDLCASGWHVCQGKEEVASKAPNGCADAVPPGTPDKMLFFAVYQHSTMNTVCDDPTSMGDNDVFGCGNLGVQLTSDKNCGPLDRALASTAPGTCGFNEAMPPLGPWQCPSTVARSDLHEGAVVTKDGCPNASCSYNGAPIGNSDKGGVLCCHDGATPGQP